mgnify:CR=1 FL=1
MEAPVEACMPDDRVESIKKARTDVHENPTSSLHATEGHDDAAEVVTGQLGLLEAGTHVTPTPDRSVHESPAQQVDQGGVVEEATGAREIVRSGWEGTSGAPQDAGERRASHGWERQTPPGQGQVNVARGRGGGHGRVDAFGRGSC